MIDEMFQGTVSGGGETVPTTTRVLTTNRFSGPFGARDAVKTMTSRSSVRSSPAHRTHRPGNAARRSAATSFTRVPGGASPPSVLNRRVSGFLTLSAML